MKVLRSGDYILITDLKDSRYLKIGEIIKIDYDYGDKNYTVRFRYDKETGQEDIQEYRYDLPDKCKLMDFR